MKFLDLPVDVRELLAGRLTALWGATSDAIAFDALTLDKQQALLLLLQRLKAKQLWPTVRTVENIYGEGGVGMQFRAWPFIQSTLARRRDFTRLFARHRDTSGGFYEKGRATAVLHFLFQEGSPRKWYVHFDRYSPVLLNSVVQHLYYEVFRKLTPDWKVIRKSFHSG